MGQSVNELCRVLHTHNWTILGILFIYSFIFPKEMLSRARERDVLVLSWTQMFFHFSLS